MRRVNPGVVSRALLLGAMQFVAGPAAQAQTPARAWLPLPPLPIAVRSPAAATDGERVYVVGGSGETGRSAALQILDLTERRWTLGSALPRSVDWASAVWVSGELHVLGGVADGEPATTQHLVYDGENDQWFEATALPTRRAGAAAVAVDSQIYLLAGNSGGTPAHTSGTFVFDVAHRDWTRAVDVPGPRINMSAAVAGGRIHLIGGGTPGLETSGEMLAFDPREEGWVDLGRLDEPREAHAVAAANGVVCVAGGRRAARGNFNRPVADTYCYRAEGGAPVLAPRLPAPRQELVGVSLAQAIIVLGGADQEGRPVGDVWLLGIR